MHGEAREGGGGKRKARRNIKRERGRVAHRTTGKVREGVRPAIAHGYEAQVREGVLVEEFPDEGLQVEGDHGGPARAHVGNPSGLGKVHNHLHSHGRC